MYKHIGIYSTRMMPKIRNIVLFLLFSFSQTLYSQGFGLRFFGQEFDLDKRTGLELLPEKDIQVKSDFTISFDLSFLKNYNSYFGYIFRIIINDDTNLDLIYENKFDTLNTLNLILADKSPLVMMNVDKNFFYDWEKIILSINSNNQTITLKVADSVFTINNIEIDKKDKLKVFFGGNDYKSFQTSDLPNMTVKNIELFENNRLKYHWTLDQMSGNIVVDQVSGKKAVVKNPFWLGQLHSNWILEKSFTLKGFSQVVHNPNRETIEFYSPDSLIIFDIDRLLITDTIAFIKPINLQGGMQLLYEPVNDKLFAYSLDLKIISEFDKSKNEWNNSIPEVIAGTDYFHHNKFFDPVSNSLVFLGGYGQLTYKNDLFKLNLDNFDWDTLDSNSKIFTPRYLFGLGENSSSDTIYIIGGYGSETGDQKQRPQYWYDFIRYIPKTGIFEKVYSLESQTPGDFCFSNSIIIDQKSNSFYGLSFSKHHYNGNLNLVKGSLKQPEYQVLATPIPFTFHDIKSYAELFYSESSKTLFAVSLFYNENNITEIKIYSLLFPPANTAAEEAGVNRNMFFKPGVIIPALIFAAGIILTLVYIRRKQKVKVAEKPEDKIISTPQKASSGKISDTSDSENTDITWRQKPEDTRKTSKSILLFGGFQTYAAEGEDITSQFTPLLKELFLLILLNSIADKKGISSNKMNEILWFDKTEKDARNNRAVNIARLKSLLQKIGNIEVSKQTGYWKIDFLSDDVYVDLFAYHAIVNSKQPTKENIIQLINITRNGSFLVNSEYEWLDEFKSDTSNHIIDTLIDFADNHKDSLEPSLIIHIADTVFFFDPLNEEAMVLKCKTLSKLGKHSLAKNTYLKFTKEYLTLYNEDYSRDFNEIVE